MCNRPGEPHRRIFLLLFLSLSGGIGWGTSSAEEDIHPLIQGVRIEGPRMSDFEDPDPTIIDPPRTSPGPSEILDVTLSAGQDLLNHFGCVTCHDLPFEGFSNRRGPDLDRIGEKTSLDWLLRWLENPAAISPNARMPRVPLSYPEKTEIAAFLSSLKPRDTLAIGPGAGRPDRGRDLYIEAGCPKCHLLGGEGGTLGPSLDDAGTKLRKAWVIAYLSSPSSVLANARMPEYEFSEHQVENLAAYLLGPVGEKTLEGPPPTSEASIRAGLSAYAQQGCARCHHIQAFKNPVEYVSKDSSESFINHHRSERPHSPRIHLSKGQIEAMSLALMSFRAEETGEYSARDDVEGFLQKHWGAPIPPQGAAPAVLDSLTSELGPDACGACHVSQWRDWRASLHSRSMGPGVMGQLKNGLMEEKPGSASICQGCHAPLWEQHLKVPEVWGYRTNPDYCADLQSSGLSCATCHVRGHRRFGPPPGAETSAQVWGAGHGGAVIRTAFERSEFCRKCHQFPPSGTRVNGKLLQNTHNEWMASPQGRRGETCQTCHMPERRHLWLGVHDPEMTRKALLLKATSTSGGDPDSVRVTVEIENVGAGHHLPTYVTPAIFVTARLLDRGLNALPGTEQVRVIQRRVILTVGENRELFDTRIPAGGQWIFDYIAPGHDESAYLEVGLEVHPDDFYRGFFETYRKGGLSEPAQSMIDSAWKNTTQSPYQLMDRRWSLEALREVE